MTRTWVVVAWSILILVGRVAGVDAQDLWQAFPRQTAVVLRIASIDKLSGGFNEFSGALGPAAANAGADFERGLSEMLSIPGRLEAIDRGAPALVAAFPLRDERQPVAYLVRTPDEDKLRRAVLEAGPDDNLAVEKRDDGFEKVAKDDRTWFFGPGPAGDGQSGWVIYTPNETVVGLLASVAGQPTFAEVVEPSAAELVEAGHAAVIVNVAHLTEVYAGELDEARRDVLRSIEQLPDEALSASGTDPDAIRKIYSDLAGLGFDAAGDACWAAGRVNIDAEGIALAGRLGIEKGSDFDTLLAASPPVAFESLGLLPAGAAAYFGFHWNYEQISSWMQEWGQVAYGADSQNAEKLKASFEQFKKAGAGPMVGSFTLPTAGNKGIIAHVLQEADDPELLKQGNREYQSAIGDVETPIYSQSIEYQEAAETYKERPIDLMTQTIELGKADDPGFAIAQQFIERFLGGKSIATRVTLLENLFIQTTANDAEHLHRVLDGIESGEGVLGLAEAFAQTRDHLAPEANLVVLLNAPQVVIDFVRMLREIPPFNALLAQVPLNLGAQPAESYGGLSVSTGPQVLGVQLYVPVGQPKGIMQIFGQGF